MSDIPAGWYEDDWAPGHERWWDGNEWTDHTRPDPRLRQRPAPRTPSPAGYADEGRGGHAAQSTPKPWFKRGWVLALGAVVLLFVAVAIAGGEDDETADNQTGAEVEAGAGAAVEGDTAGDAAAVTAAPAPVVEGPEPTCTYAGTGGLLDRMQVELTFTNPLAEVNGLEVTYALLDGEGGTRFYTGTAGGLDLEWVKFPAANEQFRLSVSTGEEVPPNIDATTIGCSVLAIEESTNLRGYARATAADTCTVLGADSSGDIQVELTVTSPYEETLTVQTWWAFQAPGPVRFDTETEVVDLVAAGELFKINPQFGVEKPAWIGDGEVTCAVVGFWSR